MAAKISVGDRIKLTGKFLRSTGQFTGPEGLSKWTVRACECDLCAGGDFVCTDQKATHVPGMYTAEELATYPSLAWRHINRANVYRVGTLDSRNSP